MPNTNSPDVNTGGAGGNVLKTFQIDPTLSIEQKANWAYGKSLAQYIESTVNGGSSMYFWNRNQRWKVNRSYANGRVNMQRFMDLLEFNGKVNYANIFWQSTQIVNRIISGVVGRWMQRNEKIQVSATDTLSKKEKEKNYREIEFAIQYREQLLALQEQSGVQMMPEDPNLPLSVDELLLWKDQFDRLPEEIEYELACNDILASQGWFDVLKEKMLHDSAAVAFVGTYTYMDDEGVVHIEYLKPENCFYSYSNFPDFRDTTWRGYMRTLKISELRKKYGAEFGGKLTEEQIWNIAQSAKEYQLYDNITWLTDWNVTFLRPYDEWNVTVLEYELRTVDKEPYTITTTKKNKSTIINKGIGKKSENTRLVEDTRINIYRGVYERTTQTQLEWGLKKNMIRPQDPKEMGNAEFSYSFYMPQNFDMLCLAIPEKIQEPADQMIIARLKMQQLVAKMRPVGAAINWDALQNIDYGLGDGNKAIDVKKLYDQTGDIYYRSRDAEGNPIPLPIVELQNSGFLAQMQGLIALYDKHYQIMKDELGEDPNLISQAATPRVAAQNIDTAQQQAEYATDYYYWAYLRCMEDTAKKVSCLLKNSVTYGAEVYRKLVKKDNVSDRMFSTKLQMLPDSMQIAQFEQTINGAFTANPDLILFANPFQLSRIAKEDLKLAEMCFMQAQKRMLMQKNMEAQRNQDATFKAQMESAIAGEKEKQNTESLKGQIDLQKTEMEGKTSNVNYVLQMVTSLLSKGEPIPANLQALVDATVNNIMLPLVSQNQQNAQQLQEQANDIQEPDNDADDRVYGQGPAQEEMQEAQPTNQIQQQPQLV